MGKKTDKDWVGIESKLAGLENRELRDLLKAMFDLSTENRFFLVAKFPTKSRHSKALEMHRRRVIEQFFPSRGRPTLNLKKAETTADAYMRATDDHQGWYDLLLTLVESGIAINDPAANEEFYDRLMTTLTSLTGLIADYGDAFYPLFRSRLMKLADQAKNISAEYGDFVKREVKELEKKMQSRMAKV